MSDQPAQQAQPVDLEAALARFDQTWSPRIVAGINDYDVRIAKVAGDHVWHVHEHTDEFFLVLSGELRIGLRENGSQRTVTLAPGSVFTVPRGVEHRPQAIEGTTILMVEPRGTATTGDRHDDLPDHVHTSTGLPLE